MHSRITEQSILPLRDMLWVSDDMISADDDDDDVQQQINRDQKDGDSDGFLKTFEKDGAQDGDQKLRHADLVIEEGQVRLNERICDDVSGRVGCIVIS